MKYYIIFEFHSKIGFTSEIQKKLIIFGISFGLHYLCTYD